MGAIELMEKLGQSTKDLGWKILKYDPDDVLSKLHDLIESKDSSKVLVLQQEKDVSPSIKPVDVYAMEHPGTYVATVECPTDNLPPGSTFPFNERFTEILKEAGEHEGPAVVVVFLGKASSLYRFNPMAHETFRQESGTISPH